VTGAQFILLAALTTAVGVAMTRIGTTMGLLRKRAMRRHCSSCGRLLSPRGCKHCGV
jgi:hypothetical protein